MKKFTLTERQYQKVIFGLRVVQVCAIAILLFLVFCGPPDDWGGGGNPDSAPDPQEPETLHVPDFGGVTV